MKKVFLTTLMALTLSLVAASQASAVVTLPNPTDTVDGIQLASQYEDFFAYPASLMLELGFDSADWDVVTGTGGIDILVYTGADGADNDPVSDGSTFEDPIQGPSGNAPSADQISGTWGAGLQPNGPVTVDQVVDYMTFIQGELTTIPVFSFDLGEPNSPGSYLLVTGRVLVVDPNDGDAIKATWSLDNLLNGLYDPAEWVVAPNQLTLTGTSGTEYTINNNRGSGKLDYVVYSPDLDLAPYYGKGYEFWVDVNFDELDGVFEEIYITNGYRAPTNHAVPEPATMVLFGTGLLGAAVRRKFIG